MAAPPPLSAGLKNWHWRQKTVDKWAYDWFKTEALKINASDSEGLNVKITSVDAIEGDVTVGQRKSKLVTIYDIDMTLAWTGTLADGTELSGTVRIPEVSHEVYDGLSEYVFDFSSPSTSSPSYISTKKILPPQLKELFSRFQNALIDVHGKDLLKSDEGAASPGSGASTPVVAAPSSSAAASSSSTSKSTTATPAGSKLNTSTVKVQGSFQASADDLWSLLTDERKIPTWSRSSAQFSPTPDAPFSLFSGAVQGKVQSASAPNQLIMSWALKSSPSWPKDHFGTLTITLEQGSDSTTATFTLAGVPKGQEKEVESNLHAFYLRGFISMGLVNPSSVSTTTSNSSFGTATTRTTPNPTIPSSLSSSTKKAKRANKPKKPSSAAKGGGAGVPWAGIAMVGGLTAVLGGIVFSSLRD